MARSRYLDYLQDHRFWMFDISPSSAYPFLVLGAPFLGFQTLGAPEYTIEVDNIKQLNSMFKTPLYSGGEVGPITMTRGVRGWDGTMWDWMHRALSGFEQTKRNLLILHYSNINVLSKVDELNSIIDMNDFPTEIWSAHAFVPGKAYVVLGAVPTRYRPASDFDASSGGVSISELEIQPSAFVEIPLWNPL